MSEAASKLAAWCPLVKSNTCTSPFCPPVHAACSLEWSFALCKEWPFSLSFNTRAGYDSCKHDFERITGAMSGRQHHMMKASQEDSTR